MKILLVYPKYPDTFWSLKYSLQFVLRKSSVPPLGLMTVAALLPHEWEKKLIDMNVSPLKDKDLRWADYVFLSAISIQKESVKEIVRRCKETGVKIVAGGPLFTVDYEKYRAIDHFVLNEAEITLPSFLKDLNAGCPDHIYTSMERPDIRKSPVPMWGLANMEKYATMNIQYSRGCPFNCEFCDISQLYGRMPRTKDASQVIRELEAIYLRSWRDRVFFVDDNFTGDKTKLKNEVLPAICKWMQMRRSPFSFITQASIDMADDDKLMELMVRAGFNIVFVGIETPHEESLDECSKFQNKNRDMVASVRKMQRIGLQVWGGFVVGFDSDPAAIFERQIEFIRKSRIVTAMVSILNALKGTRLYNRLEKEDRLLMGTSGDNTDCSINFIPKMDYDTLISGYKKIFSTIYSPDNYYTRAREFLKEYKPLHRQAFSLSPRYIFAFFTSLWRLGIIERERWHYWKLLFWTLVNCPQHFQLAVNFAIYGFHFREAFGRRYSQF